MSGETMAKAGSLLCIDRGEYSDYSVIGFFVVLRDFEPAAELAAYLAANKRDQSPYEFRSECYLGSLIAKGLLMDVPYSTLYLGDYRSSGKVEFQPRNGGLA